MMRLLQVAKDGGPKSTVTGYWLIELKGLFTIVLLRFDPGTREVFHSHAFNAYTWFLKGKVVEHVVDGLSKVWSPSWKPKYTPRSCYHKVYAIKTTWALSFRGPWSLTWEEFSPKTRTRTTLTNGRKVIREQQA